MPTELKLNTCWLTPVANPTEAVSVLAVNTDGARSAGVVTRVYADGSQRNIVGFVEAHPIAITCHTTKPERDALRALVGDLLVWRDTNGELAEGVLDEIAEPVGGGWGGQSFDTTLRFARTNQVVRR